jgi:hypothetical protein
MEFIAIFFIVMVAGTIGLAPVFGAESRPDFLRERRATPARPWDWER